ncbi:amino acid adenylation domain-containing protein [Streptomyces sp. RB6PN25]|uniref:Amino acid adenylation domain-containing protein n=1 Tax=Streptomyces humicola TaxID=2953240 RepID=A0ABT1Q0U3_9ACTN|nr:amino acid adenylation domain-containing protein [Streptomyces humicola]MCQ4083499.1 amino acid adenylation domain-containing protein [Streptomyces humicola]
MGSTPSRDTGYWPERLAGAAPVELATDTPRLTAREYRRAVEEVSLGGGAAALLGPDDTSGGDGTAAALLTAFAVVLHRHTAVAHPVIGLDHRTPGDPAPTAGPLPVRVDVEPDLTFAEEVERTARTAGRDLRHAAELPATDLVPAGFGLVRVVLLAPGAGPDPDAEPDLDLSLERRDGVAVLCLGFNASLFARATAAWMLRHLVTLLTEAARRPELPLRDLRLLDEPGPPPLWAPPTPPGYRPLAPAGPQESLPQRLSAVAAEHADLPALSGAGGDYSYAALDRVTTVLAHRLRRSAGPGTRLALLCEHDVDAVLGVWAALKSGAAYVPLDPRMPDGRLSRILASADVTAIACSPALAGRACVLAKGRQVVPLYPVGPTADAPAPAPVAAGSPAYLLFTSGSTGRPKAVEQTHHNVLEHALAYADRIRLGPGDRLPLLARFTFDAAVMDLFGALLSGASLHVVDPLLPAPALRERLAAVGTTVVHCTPTLFRHLVGDLPESGPPTPQLATVRMVVLGGEEAGRQDFRRFLAAFPPDSALVNGLGPTECTVALQHLAGRADLTGAVLPVGHPANGVRVRLLDPDGHPTEVYGELEIVSDRVAAGYWRQPEATARAFGTGPDGVRFHRTGDLVRRRPDGSLVFQGRKDRQLKVRGHRLEPGEIEAALRAHPTVAQAALIGDERSGGDRLLAYVTAATPFPPDVEQLTSYLAGILPDYAVPWRITVLDGFPVGPTGKLDRCALPLPEELPRSGDDAPRTPVEQSVADIWCRVLGVTAVGVNASFMVSGGDSLRVLEMLSAVRDEFGVDIPLIDFLKSPTVAAVTRAIGEHVEQEQSC